MILVPESLVASLGITSSELVDLLNRPIEVIKIFSERMENLLDLENFVIELIPSLGKYPFLHDKFLNFEGIDHGDIELKIFRILLDNVLFKECKELVFDLSTGHNLYATAALKALRSLSVAQDLFNFDKLLMGEPFMAIKIKKSFSPPIVSKLIKGPYYLITEPVRARVFFDFPLDYDEIKKINPKRFVKFKVQEGNEKELEAIKRGSQIFKNIKVYLNVGLYLHNTIRHNLPLALYYGNKILLEDIGIWPKEDEVKSAMDDLIEYIEAYGWSNKIIKNDKNSVTVSYRGVNRRETLYSILALIETMALLRLQRKLSRDVDKELGVSIDKLKKDFISNIYSKYDTASRDLALNRRMLERDLNEIVESGSDKLDEGKCRLLSEVLEEPKTGREEGYKKRGDVKRNFFAHSGLSREIVHVCKKHGELYLKYKFEARSHPNPSEIVEWIKNPL